MFRDQCNVAQTVPLECGDNHACLCPVAAQVDTRVHCAQTAEKRLHAHNTQMRIGSETFCTFHVMLLLVACYMLHVALMQTNSLKCICHMLHGMLHKYKLPIDACR